MFCVAYISLWSNIWNKKQNLDKAIRNLSNIWNVSKVSSYIVTKAWWLTDQDDFLNAVCEIETEYSPENLLKELLLIEKLMWRKRGVKWWARIIDLDIIAFGREIINTEWLIIPHRYATERDFVMKPLREVDGDIANWISSNYQASVKTENLVSI